MIQRAVLMILTCIVVFIAPTAAQPPLPQVASDIMCATWNDLSDTNSSNMGFKTGYAVAAMTFLPSPPKPVSVADVITATNQRCLANPHITLKGAITWVLSQ